MSGVSFDKNEQLKDSLQNIASGMNTVKSKKHHTSIGTATTLESTQLESLYRDNWIVGAIVDLVADDATRNWFRISSGLSPEDIKLLKTSIRKLQVRPKINWAMKMSRLYGDAIVVVVLKNDKSFEEELKLEDITNENPIVALHVIEKPKLTLNTGEGELISDPTSIYFGQPTFYKLGGNSADGFKSGDKCHVSRALRFSGRQISTNSQTSGWHDSVINRSFDAIANFEIAVNAIVELLDELNIDTLRIPNLAAITNDKTAFTNLISRMKEYSDLKSVYKVTILDSSEEHVRNELALSGVKDILETFQVNVSAASRITYTRLFGTSAQGLGATGKGDEDDYDESISNVQEFSLRPNLERLVEMLIRSYVPEGNEKLGFEIAFNRLTNPTDKDVAETEKAVAEADKIYLEQGVIKPDEVRAELIDNERYSLKNTDTTANTRK